MCGEFLSTRNEFWTSFADKRKISFSKARQQQKKKRTSQLMLTHIFKGQVFSILHSFKSTLSQLKSLKGWITKRGCCVHRDRSVITV